MLAVFRKDLRLFLRDRSAFVFSLLMPILVITVIAQALFHDFFVRTYVQRLLLFDAPEFAFGDEAVGGEDARVATEVVTANDRFAVEYRLHRTPAGWRANDISVEGVSLAQNFRAQFDAAVAKDSFQGLLERLRAKVAAPAT